MSKLDLIPQCINLNKLKKRIDIKISAILAFLENDDNFLNVPKINIQTNKQIDEDNSTLAKCFAKNGSSMPTQRTLNQSNYLQRQDTQRSIPDKYINQISQNIYQMNKKQTSMESSINNKQYGSNFSIHQGVNSVQKSDQSSSKKKIQQSSALKIFTSLLDQNNINHHKQINIIPFGIVQQNLSNLPKHKLTSRNKSAVYQMNYYQQQLRLKQNFYSPQNDKQLQQHKKQLSSYSNEFHELQKLYEYYEQKRLKILSKQLIQQVRQNIQKFYKKSRIQNQQNIPRNKLLSRILNFDKKNYLLFNKSIQ